MIDYLLCLQVCARIYTDIHVSVRLFYVLDEKYMLDYQGMLKGMDFYGMSSKMQNGHCLTRHHRTLLQAHIRMSNHLAHSRRSLHFYDCSPH